MEYDLVFEGGGAKGMIFVGAMQEFEARGHTHKRLLGTSAGAITAALLAAGYTAQEMLEALGEQENGRSVFNRFLGQPGPFEKAQVLKSTTLSFLRNVDLPLIPEFIEKKLDEAVVQWLASDPRLACSYSFLEYGGLYSADHFIQWLQRRLDTGMHRGQPRHYSAMTLEQFHAAAGCNLSMIASDTTAGQMLILNHRTAPDLPLVWAVRMSMSIPFLWQEVIWQPGWGPYRAQNIDYHVIVDGGILSNFPIELFVSQNSFVKNIMGDDAGEQVLGFLIDEDLPVPGAPAPAAPVGGLASAPLIQRINNILNTTLTARDKLVRDAVENCVVRLPAHGYGTTEFDMTDERRGTLVSTGHDTLRAYFDRPQPEEPAVSFGIDEAEPDTVSTIATALAQSETDKIALRILNK